MYFSNIYPTPRSFVENDNERFVFHADVDAVVSGLSADNIDRVKTLWNRFSCSASVLHVTEARDGFRFAIGNVSCELNADDTYELRVTSDGVCIVAVDAVSLMHGIMTLIQLICPKNLDIGQESLYMSSAEVHDSPALSFRAMHICFFPNGGSFVDIEKAIHVAGFMKFSHLIFEFWGTFPYECAEELHWPNRHFSKDDIRRLVRIANSYGMEIIPFVNHFGHAAQSRGCHGRHVVLNQNLRMSMLFEPDGWTWCLSNPKSYELLSKMRDEVMEVCGDGKYFHLGFDEAISFASCPECRKRVPHELLAEYVNRLIDDVCKTGRRPIIWHDMFIRRSDFPEGCYMEANGQSRETYKALDMIDRRVLMADWNYAYQHGFNPTTPYFLSKGFDTVVCPWDSAENIKTLSNDAKKLGACGMIFTTWHHLLSFLDNPAYWSDSAWSSNEQPTGVSFMESRAMLARLYDVEGNFENAGWSICSVEK